MGGGLFCLHALARRDLRLRATADLGALAAFALFVIAAHYVIFNAAVRYGGVGLVNLFLVTLPARVALGVARTGNKPTAQTLGLVGLSVAGLLLSAWGGWSRGHGGGPERQPEHRHDPRAGRLHRVGVLGRYSPAGLNAFVMPLSALFLLPFVSFRGMSPKA